ncbi:hypothetical protein NESM_000150900 [Novymonas esmeraldas]|uniref:Uncharacterized protein n=1 Tax=Novymonas esmeraldas TaxID=1808958 RepID=A0AAW0F2X0_9TRYP
MMRPSERHQGVKSVHVHRDRIKERIQEKHRQQRQQVRETRLSGLREADGGAGARDSWAAGCAGGPAATAGCSETGPSPAHAPDELVCYNVDGSVLVPAVQDWSDIGHEFGVNIHDANVMECLMALEEEIRQEQLFHFYDQTNGNEWEDYFHSLMC